MKKERIAILGGGVGGLTAAYWLSQPEFRDRYEITVYQLGWRLGGKGASGRNPDFHQRSEEHGMHIWFGFYENAFRMMRGAFEVSGGNGPFKTWTDAFHPVTEGSIADKYKGVWSWWHYRFRPEPGTPGDGQPMPTLEEYLRRALVWLADAIDRRPDLRQALETPRSGPAVRGGIWGRIKVAAGWFIAHFLRRGATSLMRIPTYLHSVVATIESLPFGIGADLKGFKRHVLRELEKFLHSLHVYRDAVIDKLDDDPDLRRIITLLDTGVACIRGALVDDLLDKGLDSIDDQEFLAWIKKHGAYYYDLQDTERQSAYLRGLYDIPFSFGHGDPYNPRMAAGTALRCFMRLGLGYKGAYTFKMQAGMGEIVFVPIYEALKKRGVKFEFFHKVAALELSADRQNVERIRIHRQAEVKPGMTYHPLVEVPKGSGFWCWPDRPNAEFLSTPIPPVDGADFESHWNTTSVGERVLTRGAEGEDGFDQVIAAISIAGLRHVAQELEAASPKWKTMFEKVQTIRTQAVQLWMRKPFLELGWNEPELKEPALVDAYENPINAWMDQSVLLHTEQWPAGDAPKHIIYFCGPMLDDPDEPAPELGASYPAAERAKVRSMAIPWMDQHMGPIWPKVVTNGKFDWSLAYAPPGAPVVAHPIDLQYVRANINPTDRYVLSVEGSTEARLRSGESGFANLILAGDWTRNGLNAGCVEAAAMSGAQAARAICGAPVDIPGENDL